MKCLPGPSVSPRKHLPLGGAPALCCPDPFCSTPERQLLAKVAYLSLLLCPRNEERREDTAVKKLRVAGEDKCPSS